MTKRNEFSKREMIEAVIRGSLNKALPGRDFELKVGKASRGWIAFILWQADKTNHIEMITWYNLFKQYVVPESAVMKGVDIQIIRKPTLAEINGDA